MPHLNTSQLLDHIIDSLRQISDNLATEKTSQSVAKKLNEAARLAQRINRKHSPTPKKETTNSHSTDPHLDELNERLALVRDRVRGVSMQGQAGFYLYGRAGTSKTYTVRTTLDQLGVPYLYQNGHITPIGLFETLEENPNGIIVLDDVGEIFKQPTAKGILLAALGSQPNGIREVKYKRKGITVKVQFTGGIIAISNLELHGDELIAAIKSRVQTLNYNPTDDQITALMRSICANGHRWEGRRMTSKECEKVCDHLLERCKELEARPDVRMLVDKAFKDYVLWKTGESESHWKDLINSALEDQLIQLQYPIDFHVPTKREEEADELNTLEEVCKEFSTIEDRLEAFMDRTGKSKRTYHRRMRQLKALGRIPKRK